MVHHNLVYQPSSSTEAVVQRTTERIQRMIMINNSRGEGQEQVEEEPISRINPAMKRHFELEIKTLQEAPRDLEKLERLLKERQRQNEEEARHIEDIQRLVTEIEMLQFVLFLVHQNRRKEEERNSQ